MSAAALPWWRGAVIYQVYVRSFLDTNGDGQGDLAGVMAKLDYLQALGVDAVWLSPIHPSPDRDWGYDVAAYDDVHPDYGDLAAFDALLAAAHQRGLRIVLDEVLSHTSDEHPWFKASLEGGEKADWYVWAQPADDGTAPNNWLSVFGGPAWAYQPARRAHYHHKFLRQQPKLNWRTPAARAAAMDVLAFWLDRGVDGFRLDVANSFLHDDTLTDNPAIPAAERHRRHWAHASDMQRHLHDSNLPENIEVLGAIRRLVERYDDRFVFGEFSEEPERCGGWASPDEGLHSGYDFSLLAASRLTPGLIREHFAEIAGRPNHWPCVTFENHDVPRAVSRFGAGEPALAKLLIALLLALRGNVLIYQGEELGLTEAKLERRQLRDPVGDLYWPIARGRDGARTPMPWTSQAANLGFTAGAPWLPLAPEHQALAADRQEADPQSTLAFARQAIAARKASPALKWGDIAFVDAPEPILAFQRLFEAERLTCLFNLSPEPQMLAGHALPAEPLIAQGEAEASAGGLNLGAYALRVFRG